MALDPATAVERAAHDVARSSGAPLLVAVSGGLDSMVLMHALARTARARIAAIATFDHGTGEAATAAAGHVRAAARALGLAVVVGRARGTLDVREGREQAWRASRYAFLRDEAARRSARVVTAHTEDDQVETVLMRIMRGSGARGIAGLYSASDIARPFVHLRRGTLEAYARAHAVRWMDDPSNASADFFRNRIRRDLLPALRRQDASFDDALLSLAVRANALRCDLDAFINGHVQTSAGGDARLEVGARELSSLDFDSLKVIWGALASRAGLSLDRRGTRRIAEFTMNQPHSGWIPLAGGWQLEARRGQYRLRRPGSSSGITPQSRGNRSVRLTGTNPSL